MNIPRKTAGFLFLVKFNMKKKGFTVLELLIVIIIVGILAGIAVPSYIKSRERAIDKEAKANLKLIIAASKIYKMENGSIYVSSVIGNLNSSLRLALPTGSSRNWDYSTSIDSNLSCARATRNGNDSRYFSLREDGEEPTGPNLGC